MKSSIAVAAWLLSVARLALAQISVPQASVTSSSELFPLPPGFVVEPDLNPGVALQDTSTKTVKIRQGPFTLTRNGQLTADEQFITNADLPCQHCWVTAIQGGLEFENGTIAQVNHGITLQHLYILSGSGRDEVCRTYNLPQPNRLYVTGNERQTVRFNPNAQKFGQYLGGEDDWLALRWNAVSNGETAAKVYLTQTYEYIPASEAADYKRIATAYMDLGGCGGTWFSPQTGRYELKSFTWNSSLAGKILFVAGHVNAGGLNTQLYVNNKRICTAEQIYGRKSSSVDERGVKHISDSGVCTSVGNLKLGDLVHITTSYDSEQHPYDATMMLNQQEPIMAVNNIYIGLP